MPLPIPPPAPPPPPPPAEEEPLLPLVTDVDAAAAAPPAAPEAALVDEAPLPFPPTPPPPAMHTANTCRSSLSHSTLAPVSREGPKEEGGMGTTRAFPTTGLNSRVRPPPSPTTTRVPRALADRRRIPPPPKDSTVGVWEREESVNVNTSPLPVP